MNKNKPFFKVSKQANGVPLVLLEGMIGANEDYTAFREAIMNLADAGNTRIKFIINSVGGFIVNGNAMRDLVCSYNWTREVDIIGIAASMAGVFSQVASPGCLGIYENAMFMTHKPQGVSAGESADHRTAADTQDKLEGLLKNAFTSRNVKAETMKDWFVDSKPKWFTAQEAVNAGICDYVITGKQLSAKPTNVFKDEEGAFNFYNSITIETQTQKKDMNKLLMQVVLMLKNAGVNTVTIDSEEADVINALKNFQTTNSATITDFENKLKDFGKTRATDLIAAKEAAGTLNNLTDITRAKWVERAVKDFDAVNELLGDLSANKTVALPDVNEMLNRGGKTPNADTDKTDRTKWTFLDYEKNDPTTLKNMLLSDRAGYVALFTKEYGSAPELGSQH